MSQENIFGVVMFDFVVGTEDRFPLDSFLPQRLRFPQVRTRSFDGRRYIVPVFPIFTLATVVLAVGAETLFKPSQETRVKLVVDEITRIVVLQTPFNYLDSKLIVSRILSRDAVVDRKK